MPSIRITSDIEIPDSELQWSFARSGGPGGQNVNKVNSKAVLRWRPVEPPVPPAAWRRFCSSAKRFMSQSGEFVIQSQEHRDQSQNIATCEAKLRTLLQAALVPPKPRIETKPTRGSQRRRIDEKKRTSVKKNLRQNRNLD